MPLAVALKRADLVTLGTLDMSPESDCESGVGFRVERILKGDGRDRESVCLGDAVSRERLPIPFLVSEGSVLALLRRERQATAVGPATYTPVPNLAGLMPLDIVAFCPVVSIRPDQIGIPAGFNGMWLRYPDFSPAFVFMTTLVDMEEAVRGERPRMPPSAVEGDRPGLRRPAAPGGGPLQARPPRRGNVAGARQRASPLLSHAPRHAGLFAAILPEGVAALGDGAFAIAHRGGAAVSVGETFVDTAGDPAPREVGRFGGFGEDECRFVQPVDVAGERSRVRVLDRVRRVVVEVDFSQETPTCLREIVLAEVRDPEAVEVSPDGAVLVLDAGENVIRVVRDGALTDRRIGAFGRGREGMSCPHDLALGADGTIYVADSGNRRIQRYRLSDGACLGPWGSHGNAADQFIDPTGVAMNENGELLVADRYAHRIQVFDVGAGREEVARRLELPPQVRYPTRLAVLAGNLCVVTCAQPSEVWVMACP